MMKGFFFDTWHLLAEAEGAAGDAANGANGGKDGAGGGLQQMLPFFIIILFLFYFMVIRPQKKDQEYKERLKNLKKNDRVVTIGGIHGIVTNVNKEAEKIYIRVDETSGTVMTFNLGAVSRVVDDESKTNDKKSDKK